MAKLAFLSATIFMGGWLTIMNIEKMYLNDWIGYQGALVSFLILISTTVILFKIDKPK